MRLLWLDINASYSHASLALPALHAQLAEDQTGISAGDTFKVIRSTTKREHLALLNEILSFKPDFVFSTLWLFNSDYLLKILRDFKTLMPHVKILLGGPEFLGDNSGFLTANRHIDFVFRGEGEELFPSLISSLKKGEGVTEIQGVCAVSENGRYTDNGTAYVKSFPQLRYPETSSFFCWDRSYVQIETSRGCFNSCSFCVSSDCRRVENIRLDEIRKRVEIARQKGVKNIRILDRTFNANSERTLLLLDLFSDFSPDICFHVEIHPAFLSRSLMEKISLLPHGLLHIEAGIQSLDDNVLAACRRLGNSRRSLDGLIFLTSLNKFTIHADLIAGLPCYTYKQLVEDINTLIAAGTSEIQLELLKLLPGTAMRDDCGRWGIKYSPVPDYMVLETTAISSQELWKVSQLSKIMDMWYNSGYFREFFKAVIPVNPVFIVQFLEYIIEHASLSNSMTPEKRGVVLYKFCAEFYSEYNQLIKKFWIENGFSRNRYPGESLQIKI